MKQRLAIAIWNEMMRCRFLRFSLDSNGHYSECIYSEASDSQCRHVAAVLREIADALDPAKAPASDGGAR